ncbi:hypothetical protein [Pseudomonas putida]
MKDLIGGLTRLVKGWEKSRSDRSDEMPGLVVFQIYLDVLPLTEN